jgi:hypothetical protein
MTIMKPTAALLFIATGCATLDTSAERTGPAAPPLPPDAPVAAFFDGETPAEPWVEVGRVRVESVDSPDAVLAAAAARARELGANAMLVDFRWHYQSLPVTLDAAGAPHLPHTPRLNANVVAIRLGG